ncbi:hypothetical protein Lspi_2751 [Legionella spiritensis]|uniref:Uncharacterized protein n=1 Tax=Legionella spiritensis TaxID=452 RepID=A0A0W0YWC1_LEGSP|nr:hypothetical protein Lspi_2751 [Legionella spiritensis]SNV45098.1 Uncharacterised protein [Legionella spiritensis]
MQTGDIYYRLSRLMLALSQREKALSFFAVFSVAHYEGEAEMRDNAHLGVHLFCHYHIGP